jgi:2-polyprenyl-6-methoxyphenol hydroxylase-like FAD-dependent oxidoreductase
MTRVAIVGGGPVGLCLALFCKIGSDSHVTVYEKRTEYTRDQILLLNHDTVWTLQEEIGVWESLRAAGACFTTPPALGSKGVCARKPVGFENSDGWAEAGGPYYSIPTRIMETTLARVAREKGVHIVMRAPTPRELEEADVVVGAEGASGGTVSKMMGSRLKTLPGSTTYGLGITYTPRHRKPPIPTNPTAGMAYSTDWKNRQHRLRYFTSPTSKYYMGLQITKGQYERSRTAKTVCDLPEDVKRRIRVNMRHVGDVSRDTCFQAFAFPVVPQIRWPLAKLVKNKLYALVGDSAFTSHFFSGLGVNNGIKMAYYLSTLIHRSPSQYKVQMRRSYVPIVKNIVRENMFYWKLVMMNPEVVLKVCKSVSNAKLRDLAKQNRVNITKLNRTETCLSLGPVRLTMGSLSHLGKGGFPTYYSPFPARGSRYAYPMNNPFTFSGVEKFGNPMQKKPGGGWEMRK